MDHSRGTILQVDLWPLYIHAHTCTHEYESTWAREHAHTHTHTHTERLKSFLVFSTSGGTHINQYQIHSLSDSLIIYQCFRLPFPIMVYRSANTLAKGALQTLKIWVRTLLVACLPSMHKSLGSARASKITFGGVCLQSQHTGCGGGEGGG